MSTAARLAPRPGGGLSRAARRGILAAVIVVVLIGIVLGTKAVPDSTAAAGGADQFDPATYGAQKLPGVTKAIEKKAVDAPTLAAAIAKDPKAAEKQYAVASSGGPVYSVTVTGKLGKGDSGLYPITGKDVPDGLLVRMQGGPAVNGTELRDASGTISFGNFTNQIEYQNAGAALNDQMKKTVLTPADVPSLVGKKITVTGAFTLLNPKAWLITPVALKKAS